MANKEAKEFTLQDWVESPISTFDFMEQYTALIKPKTDEIIKLCEELGLPYFMTFTVAMSEDSGGTVVSAGCKEVGRLSPEYLAHRMVQQFTGDSGKDINALLSACREKFGGGEEEESDLSGLSELFQRLMAP